MKIDPVTLRELGIIDRTGAGTDLLSWLVSISGTQSISALGALIQHPLTSESAIRRRQADLTGLASIVNVLPRKELAQSILEVQRYLGSRYLELPASSFRCAIIRLRHGDQFAELTRGLRDVAKFMALAEECVTRLRAARITRDADSELSHISEAVDGLLASAPMQRLRKLAKRRRIPARLKLASLDHHVRLQARPLIETCLAAMWLLDALASLASLIGRPGFTFPEILPPADRRLEMTGLFHPQLNHVIPNDVLLDGAEPLMVLTGPNMAGKSTLLRAIGAAVLLAHVGAPIPARHACISRCDRLFAVFGVSDSLLRGESYFLAEVRRVGELASALDAGDATISLVDEAFRGTNVSDASDATALLVESLRQCDSSLSIVATHLVEVAERFAGAAGVSCACFDAHHDDTAWCFPFRLRKGVSSQRLGMLLLEREGVVATLQRIQARNQPG